MVACATRWNYINSNEKNNFYIKTFISLKKKNMIDIKSDHEHKRYKS